MKHNVLSLEQLLFQGIEVVTPGDTCTLKKMFGDRAKGFDIFENRSEVDLEQEYFYKFYENLDVENGYLNEKEKLQEYAEDFYEKEFEVEMQECKERFGEGISGRKKDEVEYSKRAKLGLMIYMDGKEENPQESRKAIRKRVVMIAQDVIEKDIIVESCLDVLDLIILHEELVGHELFYEGGMEDVINWFIPCFLGMCKEGEMPLTLLNGKPIELITLYRVVKEYGGFKKVGQDDAWDKIALQCGFDCDDDFEVKVAYVRYIELVEWYYEVMKSKCEKSESNKFEAGSSGSKDDKESNVIESEDEPDLVIIVEVTDKKDE
ncbi:putative transcription factor & chromatin remodeling ARID family [Helianthus annuus]|nr:putative transcription factor & chromatin remodeling ARID family [Helianthus annuus]